jgi:hypothetical protein
LDEERVVFAGCAGFCGGFIFGVFFVFLLLVFG